MGAYLNRIIKEACSALWYRHTASQAPHAHEVTWRKNKATSPEVLSRTIVTAWRNRLWSEGMSKGDERRRGRKLEERKPRIAVLVDLGVVYGV